MMNVKLGTTSWSKTPQEPVHTESSHNMSAVDTQKSLGGDDVGKVLNKIADSNWVDPEKTRKVGNNQLDKDAFMKLMLTQMKYQDPSSPMQSHEMAAQLAQFTSLEQLNNINSTLQGMSKSQAPSLNYQALSFIGKKVSGDSSKLTRIAGDKDHEFHFNLMGDASKIKVEVLDAEGNTVRKLEMNNLKKGDNQIKWNGLAEDGLEAKPGDYRFNVEAFASNGARVFAKSDFEGRITGLNYTANGPVLLVGNQAIRMSDVKRIEEAQDMQNMNAQAQETQNKVDEIKHQTQTQVLENLSPSKKGSGVSSTQSPISKSVAMSGPALKKYTEASQSQLATPVPLAQNEESAI